MTEHFQNLYDMQKLVEGYIYPNEIDLQWGVLIVLYPYITGLVAGAFILASLERVFNVKVLKPTYHIALLTSLAFLLVATLPLVSHLAQPIRAYEIMITPHSTSAMAIFGFVYLWYLMVVLLLEIWFEYRQDMVRWSNEKKGLLKWAYKALTLGVNDMSPKTNLWDDKIGYFITVVGIPSAFLLHGYVGFIFGSIKANPWWSTVLMPVIFLFSAMVSGIALVLFVYMVVTFFRKKKLDMACLDGVGKYLFYILLIDFTLEALDQVHRIYVAEESFEILQMMMAGKLYLTLIVIQLFLGTLVPIFTLGFFQFYKPNDKIRKTAYFLISNLVLFGIFFMRWNVVIGGQLFSKSFYGFTSFKIGLIGTEGYLWALFLGLLPFGILAFLMWFLPPWKKHDAAEEVSIDSVSNGR